MKPVTNVSMEPRFFSHGYAEGLAATWQEVAEFQWSHGFSAMDTLL